MFETILDHFQHSALSLWGPFAVLILCGLGLPIPEDVVLIAAGALGMIDGRGWIGASVVMYAGVMIGDSMTFFAGRYLGGWLRATSGFRRIFSAKKQEKVQNLFEKYHSWVFFVGRFLPGLRAPIFFTAGSTRVGFWKFFLFDGLAAVLSVPAFVWLGHWLWSAFGDDLEQLQDALARTKYYTLLLVLVIAAVSVVAVFRIVRNARIKWDE